MSDRVRRRHCVAPRFSNAVPAWALSVVRAFLLLAIMLLPVQMRAGSGEAHPHSILQLVIDARDGVIDHHGMLETASHHVQAHEAHGSVQHECIANTDLPTVEETGRLGGISLLSAPLFLLLIPAFGSERTWPRPRSRHGRQPELEPPPPRDHYV